MQTIKTNYNRTVNTVRALTESFNRVMGKDAMQSEGNRAFVNGKHVIEFNGEYYANNGKLVEFLVNEFNNVWIALGCVDLDYLAKQLHTGCAPMFTIYEIETPTLAETLTETTQDTSVENDEELTASAKLWSDNYTAYKNSVNKETSAKRVLLSDNVASSIYTLIDANIDYCIDASVNIVNSKNSTKYYFNDKSFIVLKDGVYSLGVKL